MTEGGGFTELHNHILPGVDDGARTLEESLRHLRLMAEDGVTRLAFSPHLFGWLSREPGALARRLDELERVFERVREACAGRADLPALELGQEVLLTDPPMVGATLADPRVRHGASSWVLIEFGFSLPDRCLEILDEVLAAGRRPLIAHPERYRRDDRPVPLDEVRAWKQRGAALQLNAGSILGGYAPAVCERAWTLLAHGLADVIGSDNHADHRPQLPREAAEELRRRGGAEQARLLLAVNPARVLDDLDPLPVAPLGRVEAA